MRSCSILMEGKLLGLSQPEPLPALLVNHLAPPQSERCFPSEREFGRICDSVFNSGTSFSTMPKGAKFLAVGKSHMGRASGKGNDLQGVCASVGRPIYQRLWPQSWWWPPLGYQTEAFGHQGNLGDLSPASLPWSKWAISLELQNRIPGEVSRWGRQLL